MTTKFGSGLEELACLKALYQLVAVGGDSRAGAAGNGGDGSEGVDSSSDANHLTGGEQLPLVEKKLPHRASYSASITPSKQGDDMADAGSCSFPHGMACHTFLMQSSCTYPMSGGATATCTTFVDQPFGSRQWSVVVHQGASLQC